MIQPSDHPVGAKVINGGGHREVVGVRRVRRVSLFKETDCDLKGPAIPFGVVKVVR